MPKKTQLKVFLFARKSETMDVLSKLFEAFTFVPHIECIITIVSAETVEDSCLLKDSPTVQLHSKNGDLFYSGDFSDVEKLVRLLELAK